MLIEHTYLRLTDSCSPPASCSRVGVDLATFRLRQYRSLAARGVASRVVLHATGHRLIDPTDLGAFGLGPGDNDREFILEPLLNRLGALLVGALDRALRREAPARQILANGAHRQIHQEHSLDRSTHSLGAPQRKLQLQLVGRSIHQLFLDALFLRWRQNSPAAFWPTALTVFQRRSTALGVGLLEQNDEWALQHRHVPLETLAEVGDNPTVSLSAVTV